MNIFTSIGIIVLLVAALRLAYIVLAVINPEFVVLTTHRAISCLPGTLSIKARQMWWDHIAKNCSREHRCIECAREEQRERRVGGE